MKITGMIFGLIVVVIGAAMLFDNLDVSGNYPVGDYWPAILIALGFFGFINSRLRPEFGNMVLMSLGGILLTHERIHQQNQLVANGQKKYRFWF